MNVRIVYNSLCVRVCMCVLLCVLYLLIVVCGLISDILYLCVSRYMRRAANLRLFPVYMRCDELPKSWQVDRVKKKFIIKVFRTIVFIFIVISTTFRPIYPLAFFRCLSNTGTFTELRTTSFIETTGVTCSDSVSHNRVQVLSIPIFLLACSEDWTCNLQMIVSLEA